MLNLRLIEKLLPLLNKNHFQALFSDRKNWGKHKSWEDKISNITKTVENRGTGSNILVASEPFIPELGCRV
jgi:hypothetical protein